MEGAMREGSLGMRLGSAVVAAVMMTSGCAGLNAGLSTEHFAYPLYAPNSYPQRAAASLKVAVVYPEEALSPPDRDQDFQPIIESRCTQLPTYISPRLEISRGLRDELQASGEFAVVDWTPGSTDDYDLIVRSQLLSAGERFKSDTCPMMLGPFQWQFTLFNQRGTELVRWGAALPKTDIFARSVVGAYRVQEAAFLGDVVKPILAAGDRLAATDDLRGRHALAFAQTRDPGLAALRDRRSQDYMLTIATLESMRLIEARAELARQQIQDKAWAGLQAQSARQLDQLGEDTRRLVRQAAEQCLETLLGGVLGAVGPGGPLAIRIPLQIRQAALGELSGVFKMAASPDGISNLLQPIATSLKMSPADFSRLTGSADFAARLAQNLRDPQGDSSWVRRYQALVAEDPPEAGCSKDTDCKGERICAARQCVDPPTKH